MPRRTTPAPHLDPAPRRQLVAGLVAFALLGGCAVQPTEFAEPTPLAAALASDNGMTSNGLSTNGVSLNGLSFNGVSPNGLSTNGVSPNGLATGAFTSWFNLNPSYSDMVMRYVVRCAVATGQSRTYRSTAGVNYSWPGGLGLAPVWASGQPIPVAEQQIMTACLGAHVNKFGVHVSISIRGAKTNGQAIPASSTEDALYDEEEGCFFGNLFNGGQAFVGYSTDSFEPTWSSPRACAIESGLPGVCAPLVHVGLCKNYCTQFSQTSHGIVWGNCTYQGTSYKSISTRLRSEDIFICGDGVCQFTEAPYSASARTGCLDCGQIP